MQLTHLLRSRYNQGSRAGKWREVFPYFHDTGWDPIEARFNTPLYFNALETEE